MSADALWTGVSTLVAAVFGALIAAGVSWWLQRNALTAAEAQRREERLEIRKALGYALLFKLIRLTSDLHNLGRAVREKLDAAQKEGVAGAPFQIVVPVVPLPDKITFSPEEMALALSLDSELFNKLAPLDDLHSNTVALFDLYHSRRNAVLGHFGAEVDDAGKGTTALTEAQFQWLQPRAYELNGLVTVMLQRTEQDGEEAWAALDKLHEVLTRELGLKHRLERKDKPV